ncbi:pHCl [Drosophila busckii]|uniref:PHCl n=1 Tax=Drosophila busckii TaxID=30019 RepID=A0A0M3QWH2_DROBS|nr:pHCl [Drosophila busckii]
MGCAFEAAREQPKPRIKSAKRNQCDTTTTAIDTTTTTQRLTENLEIKDNYQQNHKTQTTTVKANTKQLKAAAQVLLTVQQQPQPQPKSQQLEQLQTLRQVALENKDALATHETIGARIDIKANSSDLQNSCHVNCHKRSEINRDEQQQQRRRCRRRHWRQDHTNRAAHSQERRSHSIVAATMVELPQCQQQLHEMLLHARAALMTSKQSSQQEAAAAASAAAEQSQQAENKLEQQQPLAYQHWRLKNVASAVVPATMSAAILANLSATSAAAYQYLGQHYKHYTQSFSFYAASSVILMLCYLTTTSTAAATQSETGALDKHPIHGIDWSKFDESSSDKEILDLLLEKKRYDKRLLPPVNGTLTVNVNVLLLSLASPDESSLKYEVEFLLNQQWNDPRLQYGNKSHYDFLNALHHHDSIWTPDTYFIMHGDFKDPIIPMHFALRIFRNGTITYAMRRHLILSCQGSLHIFPFDDPKCSFSMESISYEEAQIKYVWKNDEDTLRKSPSLTTLNAYLIKNQTTACDQNSWRGNYSCLRVDLIFTRDRAFYFTTVFIPGIILVTSSFITFWLEWNAVPARSMIGNYSCLQVELTFTRDRAYYFTTVFIPGIILVTSSFITFWLEWNAVPARVMIGTTLPVVSNLTAMNVWDGVCMCFIYASLLEFVCVNYVGRKRPLHNVVYRPGENPVTQGEKRRDAGAPNEIVACTTCGGSNSPCTHSANNGCATETCFVQVRKKEPPHPIRVAKTIDVIARITFPTAYAIFLIFFFVHYKGFS